MIVDILENIRSYTGLSSGFVRAAEFLMGPAIRTLPVGNYEIDGERVFAMVSKEQGRAKEDAQLEAHRRYIDIQAVLAGTDTMGWKSRAHCTRPSAEYDEKSDLQFFLDAPDIWVPVQPGAFAIFFPEDAHMPLISTEQIHKIVVKILWGQA